MRKPMQAHVFRAIVCLSLIGFAGACTAPVAPESARAPTIDARADQSTAPRPNSTASGTTEESDATVASDTVGRGGGFIGSGH